MDMDKDRIKGKMEDIGGRIERQAGEWTGDKETQAEGIMKNVRRDQEDVEDRDRDLHGEKDAA